METPQAVTRGNDIVRFMLLKGLWWHCDGQTIKSWEQEQDSPPGSHPGKKRWWLGLKDGKELRPKVQFGVRASRTLCLSYTYQFTRKETAPTEMPQLLKADAERQSWARGSPALSRCRSSDVSVHEESLELEQNMECRAPLPLSGLQVLILQGRGRA